MGPLQIFEAIDWDLTEQFNEGVNPAYGVPTPTLVSPPKVKRIHSVSIISGRTVTTPIGHSSVIVHFVSAKKDTK